jgi:hypothetical protein
MRGKLVGTVLCVALAGAVSGCRGTASPASSSAATATTGPGASTRPSTSPVAPSKATGKPSVAVSTAPPVKIGATATLPSRVLVSVGAPRRVTVGARGPGEVAGPAFAVRVTVTNGSPSPFDLGGLTVNASYGRQETPASPSDADPAAPLRGRLAPGADAVGTYVFGAPAGATGLRVEVVSNSAAEILVFRS